MTLTLPKLAVSTLLAVVGYLGGVAGAIVGAYNVGDWHTFEQLIITAIGGALVIVTHSHVTKKVVNKPPTAAAKAVAGNPFTST